MRRLLDSEILVSGEPGGIGDAGREQGKGKVIAPVNRQVGDVLLNDSVRLAASFSFHHGRLVGNLDNRGHLRRIQFEIGKGYLPDGDGDAFSNFSCKTRHFHTDVVSGWRQAGDSELAGAIGYCRALQTGLSIHDIDSSFEHNPAGRVGHSASDFSRGAHALGMSHKGCEQAARENACD